MCLINWSACPPPEREHIESVLNGQDDFDYVFIKDADPAQEAKGFGFESPVDVATQCDLLVTATCTAIYDLEHGDNSRADKAHIQDGHARG